MNSLRRWLNDWWQRRMPPAPHVRLGRRLIFIVPTTTGWAFAGALVLMLLIGINYQNSLAYSLTFLLGSLGLLAALHTWHNLVGLELQSLRATSCYAGEQAVFRLQLSSADRARHGIALGWRAPLPILTEVEVNSSHTLLLELPATERGWLKAPRLRVETRFPLGIWVAWSQIDLDMQALVYPQPLDAALPLAAARNIDDDDAGQLDERLGADDYRGLEMWQKGDSLRRIDWKAWSRGQGLWVKQFGELQGSDTVLDYSQLQGDSEQRLSLLCFHVLRLHAAGQLWALQLPGQLLGPDSSLAHRDACLRALALFGREQA